jgi:hypothetical protein
VNGKAKTAGLTDFMCPYHTNDAEEAQGTSVNKPISDYIHPHREKSGSGVLDKAIILQQR